MQKSRYIRVVPLTGGGDTFGKSPGKAYTPSLWRLDVRTDTGWEPIARGPLERVERIEKALLSMVKEVQSVHS